MPAPTLHPALARSDFPLLATFSSQAVPIRLLHLPVLLVDGFTENSWTGPSPNVHKGMPGHRATTNAATLPKASPPAPTRAVEAEVCAGGRQGEAAQEA